MIRRPQPVPTELTRGFWDAAARRVLSIQRCRNCGQRFHPPVPVCSRCHCEKLRFDPVSGLGTIYAYTVMTEALVPGFAAGIPLVVAAVELDEQEGLVVVSNLVDFGGTEVPIGARVEVAFEELPDGGGTLPQFRFRDELIA
ncbi:Zn-ribbon domain-containing OB-fold protein [Nocardia pseudovaccinii]|uniref:Zn-ribbon domain-containing OB-fold protein n=1 Tax=Nocardia pseudovaccinii TaxID=189540 RepID=UPI0007C8641C|nr:OB-fold domain-containing protein [Nocardia pseudovaccinii]